MFSDEVKEAIAAVVYDQKLACDWIRITQSLGYPYGEAMAKQAHCRVAFESDFYSHDDLVIIAAMISFAGTLEGRVNQEIVSAILGWEN